MNKRENQNVFDQVYQFLSDNGFDKVLYSDSWEKTEVREQIYEQELAKLAKKLKK